MRKVYSNKDQYLLKIFSDSSFKSNIKGDNKTVFTREEISDLLETINDKFYQIGSPYAQLSNDAAKSLLKYLNDYKNKRQTELFVRLVGSLYSFIPFTYLSISLLNHQVENLVLTGLIMSGFFNAFLFIVKLSFEKIKWLKDVKLDPIPKNT